MPPVPLRLSSDTDLPARVDTVIIGGGVVGASAAYVLAQQGRSVALLEKGRIGAEQSSRNWGWCRQQNRDARELPLSAVAMQMWDEMPSRIGADMGFRRTGLIYATDDPAQLAAWESWRALARQFNVRTHMLSAEEARALGGGGRKWLGGVHSPDDGLAEPTLAAPRIAEGARASGATLHQNCAARGLELTNNRVTGVVTEAGRIETQSAIVAAGAWAGRFLAWHGVRMPQASVRQTTLTAAAGADLGDAIYNPECAITRRLDGSYTLAISGKAVLELTPQSARHGRAFLPMFVKRLKAVEFGLNRSFFDGPGAMGGWTLDAPGPFERMRVADSAPTPRMARLIRDRVDEMFPALAGQRTIDSWGAWIDSTPDSVPVISTVGGVQGLVVAAGCSGHGFGLGPGIGRLAAELATDAPPCVDPHPFRLSRFSDPGRIEVGEF